MRYFFLLLFFAVSSCTNPPYRGCEVCGADDFVIDSYQVREGKFGILQLEGKDYGCLDTVLLDQYRDVICEGDLLHIAVHHPVRKDIEAAISVIGNNIGYRVCDGMLHLPDLCPIEVCGLTIAEAKEKIERAYREEIQDVEVFLSYRDRSERKVELLGLVDKPSIQVDGKMRLFETLSQAKISPNANLFKSYVIRDNRLLPVDLNKLIKEGDMSQNIVMQGGDKIYLANASDSTFMILGEVNKQRVVDLPNGSMPLRQALAEGGGIPVTGDKRFIQVIRGNMLNPKIYTLNWKHVVQLPSDSLLVIPGDIVYVAATPIAEWDRFVNQILPTLVGIDLVTRSSKSVGIIVP